MFNNIPMTKKTNSRKFCKNMLSKPNSQITEVLFELMANYKKGMTRNDIANSCHALNVAEVIRILRKHGAIINIQMIKAINKYGRNVKYGRYYLANFKNAVEVYETLIQNNNKPV